MCRQWRQRIDLSVEQRNTTGSPPIFQNQNTFCLSSRFCSSETWCQSRRKIQYLKDGRDCRPLVVNVARPWTYLEKESFQKISSRNETLSVVNSIYDWVQIIIILEMISPHFVSETPLPYDESKKVVAHLDQETSIVMKKFEQMRGVHTHTSYKGSN